MGKWCATPDYTDDVLHYKIKRMVSGSIKRTSLEKAESNITYMDFVNDLDVEESFTSSMVDILVMELAERRSGKASADRSAKRLRFLAGLLQTYHNRPLGRHFSHRRSAHWSDYLNAPPLDMDIEEDEDVFEQVLSNEGARLSSDSYEAHGTFGPTLLTQSPPAEDEPLPQPSNSRGAPWSMMNSIPATSLTRQLSIRRPMRSRTVDFNEFTHGRRSSNRDRRNDSRDDLPESWGRRRFFPAFRRYEPSEPWHYMPTVGPSDAEEVRPLSSESSNAPWSNLTPPIHRDPAALDDVLADAEVSDERGSILQVPRLRRGGIRAPEEILSRNVSPVFSLDPPPDTPYEPGPSTNIVAEDARTGIIPTPPAEHEDTV